MKKSFFRSMLVAAVLVATIQFSACKGKKAESSADTTTKVADTSATTAPVTIANDDELTTGVKDATKDFPGVKATVTDGEITLTGSINRDRLPVLMQSLSTLHPKKINNNLTINK